MTPDQGPPDSAARRRARSAARRRLLLAMPVSGREGAEIDGLRRALGGAGLGRIDPHVTLVPPVNVRDDELVDVLRLLRAVASLDPAVVRIGPARTFAPRTPVVYLEVTGDTAGIAGLRRRLTVAPLVPEVARRERAFVPHVTVGGRVEGPRIAAALETLADFQLTATLASVMLCEQDEAAPRHPWRVIADVALGSGSLVGRGGRELTFVASTRLDPEAELWADATPGEDVTGAVAGIPPTGEPFVVTAYADDRPVAAVVGTIGPGSVEIHKWRLDERRRGEGIGGQLVRALEGIAAARGCAWVFVAAVAGGPVEGFLAHQGYARASEFDGHPGAWRTVTLGRRVG